MTPIRYILCLLLLASAFGTAWSAEPEFRAIQVHHWVEGGLSPEQIDQTIKWAKDAHFNVIQYQVRRVGDAYYNSAHEPRATNIRGGEDFDPLGYCIKKAHENGMEVHAWINVYRVWTGRSDPTNPKHVVNQHPEWVNRNAGGASREGSSVFLDPGAPKVREYTVKLVADILSKYDVDGIMLDYVRYPRADWGYSEGAVSAFNAKYGKTGKPAQTDPQWCQWRRDQVTDTVKAIAAEITRTKPYVKLSAATVAWGSCPQDFARSDAYSSTFQDWRLWMEQGIIDINMPMNYKNPSIAREAQWYADWIEGTKRWAYKRAAYCTIMVYGDNIDGAVRQVKLSRDKGLHVVGFAFSQDDGSKALGEKLKAAFKEPAPVPSLSWKPARRK